MATDPYGQPVDVAPPAYPIEEVLRLLRQAQPAPPPVAPRPGFLDRLGAGLASVQPPGGRGRAGDVFGANLLAGAARGFGGNRMAERDRTLKAQMDTYERGKAQKALETQAQIGALGKNYEASTDIAKRKASVTPRQTAKEIEEDAYHRTLGGNRADRAVPKPIGPGEARQAAAAERSADANERANRMAEANITGKLVDDYKTDSAIKGYQNVRSNFKAAQESNKLKTGFSDKAMIFAFMRALEPENPNVVREGEFANARGGAGVFERLKNLPKQYFKGNDLSEYGREQLLREMRALLRSRRSVFDQTNDQFTRRAQASESDPSLFIRSYPEDTPDLEEEVRVYNPKTKTTHWVPKSQVRAAVADGGVVR